MRSIAHYHFKLLVGRGVLKRGGLMIGDAAVTDKVFCAQMKHGVGNQLIQQCQEGVIIRRVLFCFPIHAPE